MRSLVLAAFVLLALIGTALVSNRPVQGDGATAPQGDRPRSLAVSPDGNTILTTSEGSNYIAQVYDDPNDSDPRTLDGDLNLTARSWGVCFLDDELAAITHPDKSFLSILSRGAPDESFESGLVTQMAVPEGCTEIISAPGVDGRVFVANRGRAPVGFTDTWQHSVLEIDVLTEEILATYVTEREPNAIALSPDGNRLFVGTIQGALGGAGLVSSHAFANHPATIHDGGSVLVYSTSGSSTRFPLDRYAIGSPVRGLAVWPPRELIVESVPHPDAEGDYQLYVTHVGDGGQSEAPAQGGRAIPNVISSIRLTSAHAVQERLDVIIDHRPDLDDARTLTESQVVNDTDLPTVLPDRLAVRRYAPGGTAVWQLWVANTASGTVTKLKLDPSTGALMTAGSPFNLGTLLTGAMTVVVTSVEDDGSISNENTDPASSSNMTLLFGVADDPVRIDVDPVGSWNNTSTVFSSHPTDIAWNDAHDKILVVTQFDHELVTIDPATVPTPLPDHFGLAGNPAPVAAGERNFFTFGRGFDFREVGVVPIAMVQTIACITCHPDGHLDGKVRNTLILGDVAGGNLDRDDPFRRPVAVPSVFDVGATEWIFFEGSRSIRDNPATDAVPGCGTNYCDNTRMFDNTSGFTNSALTPRSPYSASNGKLTSTQLWGRFYFETMNCTRCHGGAPSASFARTIPESGSPPLQTTGPLPTSLVSGPNRLLHDPTQSFVTSLDDNDRVSFRNMTDVGTRNNATDPEAFVYGVNTPALAGAWNNAPYFHDGRYRTLEQVLEHTWLNPGEGLRAAKLQMTGVWPQDPPDNALRDLVITTSDPPRFDNNTLFEFKTHSPTPPSGWVSASTWLDDSAPPPPTGKASDALLDFLRAVSSQTDLCPPLTVSEYSAINYNSCTTTVLSWRMPFPLACTVRWGLSSQNPLPNTASLAANEYQVLTLNGLTTDANYKIEITLDSNAGPLANMRVCRGKSADIVTKTWKTKTCISDPPPAPVARPLVLASNPFRPPLRMTMSSDGDGPRELRIFDVTGRKVRDFDQEFRGGTESVEWDGRDERGAACPAGVYFLVMTVGNRTPIKERLVLVR